jgi:endoglucanase
MGDGGGLSLSGFPSTADVLIQPTDYMAQRTVALDNTPITLRSSFDAESGAPVDQINLASLPAAEGVRYRVQIAGVGVSWATAVSEEAAYKAYYVSARGMYQNRWAGDLRLEDTEYDRPQDHVDRPDGTPTVYTGEQADWTQMNPASTPLTGARDVVGGHHDAGDFDLRATHTTIPQLLMRSYELNPAAHADGELAIPESGNGVPDLLDEALWNIQSWEALQESDGGVRAGVENVEYLGGDSLLGCRVGAQPVAVRIAGTVALRPGEAAWLTWAPGAQHYFDAAGVRAAVAEPRALETRMA